jgi:hypothetical protein
MPYQIDQEENFNGDDKWFVVMDRTEYHECYSVTNILMCHRDSARWNQL